MTIKHCNKCQQDRSTDLFGKDTRNKDGLQGICEVCRKAAKQAARDKRRMEGNITVPRKTCNKCDTDKPADSFYRDAGIADGLATICKACKDEYSVTYRAENRDEYNASMREWRANHKEEAKELDLHRTYGLPLETFKKMLSDQGGKCALCFKAPSGVRPLCVDHCHDTGKVRGLLCYGCNRLMVLIDNPELLAKAIAYKAK